MGLSEAEKRLAENYCDLASSLGDSYLADEVREFIRRWETSDGDDE